MSPERFKFENWAATLVSSKDVAAVEGLLGFEMELTPLFELFKLAVSELHGSGGGGGGAVSASTGLST